jgi:hypothetical protein
MQVHRVVRSVFAVVVLSVIVAATASPAAHAQPSTLCTVGQCFDIHAGQCTGQDCGSGLPHCAAHQICDQRGRYCPCSPAPTPTPLPPQCSSAPCGGSCAISPPCTPGPTTVCPDYVLLGECQLTPFRGCQCIPVSPPTPLPTPTATPTPCVDTVLCIIGSHWSPTACQCVPDNPAPTPCVDTVLCIIGFHWSPERCTCVPDQPHSPHAPSGSRPVHVPHAPHSPSIAAERGCVDSGGTVTSSTCCAAVGDFPNSCLIGACGCAPDASHEVRVCECGAARCFDGVTCTGSH